MKPAKNEFNADPSPHCLNYSDIIGVQVVVPYILPHISKPSFYTTYIDNGIHSRNSCVKYLFDLKIRTTLHKVDMAD